MQTFPTADGWIFIMCMTEKFWRILCDVIGRPDLPDGSTLRNGGRDAGSNREALIPVLDAELRKGTTEHWLGLLTGKVPVAPVYDLAQALDAPFTRRTGMVSSVVHPARRGAARAGQSVEDRWRAVGAAGLRTARRRQRAGAATGARDSMKLNGLKVIDLSWFLPGPFLTMALADHGAEVIKVEPPGEGDPGRHIAPMDTRTSVFFRNLNRGKKSVVLDLKDAAGREALLRLCDGADVMVESFRPGVAARLGVDYDVVSARNPRIVYCSISAFGQDGAYVSRPAHDLALEAMTGVLSLTFGDDGAPCGARHPDRRRGERAAGARPAC